jgi:hypothetical protein
MQRDARKRKGLFEKHFANRKQEVQSLYLSRFDPAQISTITGVHRRNIYKYIQDKSVPRAIPRELTITEMQVAMSTAGEPRYQFCGSPPISMTFGITNVISSAQDAIDRKRQDSTDEDVEHYYDKVLKKLKEGNENGSN